MHTPKDTNNRLPVLFDKYIHDACSKDELDEFFRLMKHVPGEVEELLKHQWEESKVSGKVDKDHWDKLFGSMIDQVRLMETGAEVLPAATENGKVVHMDRHRKTALRIAAAAAAVVILGYGFWLFGLRNDVETKPVVAVQQQVQDIAPGGNKAILTLGDGTRVVLDSVGSGAITNQGMVSVVKTGDGELAYLPSASEANNASAIQYNTVSTPRGGQYQLVLSDGTKVWLNAASSVKFPAVFAGSDRRVEITGEGYFEVAPDKQRPFYVSAAGVSVQVLGTHFNINAYDDEESIRTTLLEGSVKVTASGASLTIRPGQQARLQRSGHRLETINKADLEQAVAWKNGYFSFDNLAFRDIMRNLSRWYDLDVVYEGQVPNIGIGGKMGRDVRLSKLLEFLESAGVHFRIDGDKRKLLVISEK